MEGKNAEAREMSLYLCLQSRHEELLQAECVCARARLELETAKLEWDLLRYRLRAFETIKNAA